MSEKIYDVLQGISQVLGRIKDDNIGIYGDGEPVKTGALRREKDPGQSEVRVNDGLATKIVGDRITITYHSEIRLKETHKSGYEREMEAIVDDLADYVKREYQKLKGSALTLTKEGEVNVFIQSLNYQRAMVQASCTYRIGQLKEIGQAWKENFTDAEKRLADIQKKIAFGR